MMCVWVCVYGRRSLETIFPSLIRASFNDDDHRRDLNDDELLSNQMLVAIKFMMKISERFSIPIDRLTVHRFLLAW
jgi:hypothetical protein